MEAAPSTLVHRVIPPRNTSVRGAYPTIVFLHGRGTDENDLLGLAPYFPDQFMLISVRAPHPFQFGGGYAWYSVLELGEPEPKEFAASYQRLVAFLRDVRTRYCANSARCLLFGFSMGTVMAYSVALTEENLIDGVIAHSGYIPERTALSLRYDRLGEIDFFIAHGVNDPVIPVAFARRAKDLLVKSAARVTYREYPIGHSVSEESIGDIVGWLTQKTQG